MLIEQENIRILGLIAHPDDEVFCVGGTLAKYIAAGAEAQVLPSVSMQTELLLFPTTIGTVSLGTRSRAA